MTMQYACTVLDKCVTQNMIDNQPDSLNIKRPTFCTSAHRDPPQQNLRSQQTVDTGRDQRGAVRCAHGNLHHQATQEISIVKQELRGLAPATKAVQALQEHRGLSAAVLSSSALDVQRRVKEKDITTALGALRTAMSHIRVASREQMDSIAQVARAVEQMNHGTQANTAVVEQVSANADLLSSQAHMLLEIVSVFQLGGEHTASSDRPRDDMRPVASHPVDKAALSQPTDAPALLAGRSAKLP